MPLFKLRKKVTCAEYGGLLAKEAFGTMDKSLMRIWLDMCTPESALSADERKHALDWIPALRLFEVPLYFSAVPGNKKSPDIVRAYQTAYREMVLRGVDEIKKNEFKKRMDQLDPLFGKTEDVKLIPVEPAAPYIAPIALTEILRRIVEYVKKRNELDNLYFDRNAAWISVPGEHMTEMAKTLLVAARDKEAAINEVGMGLKLELLSISIVNRKVGTDYFPK